MNKFKIKVAGALAVVCTMIFWPGCEKVETDLMYNIVAYLDLPDVDSMIPYSEYVEIFVHEDRDLDEWWVESYEDARQGIMTPVNGGTKESPVQQGWLNEDKTAIVVGPFSGPPMTLVAYDRERHAKYESKMYGWRNIDVQPGLGNMRIALIFKPEEAVNEDKTEIVSSTGITRLRWESSRWYMANDNPWVKPTDGDGDGDGDEDGEGEGEGEGGEG